MVWEDLDQCQVCGRHQVFGLHLVHMARQEVKVDTVEHPVIAVSLDTAVMEGPEEDFLARMVDPEVLLLVLGMVQAVDQVHTVVKAIMEDLGAVMAVHEFQPVHTRAATCLGPISVFRTAQACPLGPLV